MASVESDKSGLKAGLRVKCCRRYRCRSHSRCNMTGRGQLCEPLYRKGLSHSRASIGRTTVHTFKCSLPYLRILKKVRRLQSWQIDLFLPCFSPEMALRTEIITKADRYFPRHIIAVSTSLKHCDMTIQTDINMIGLEMVETNDSFWVSSSRIENYGVSRTLVPEILRGRITDIVSYRIW